jgi:hypothetical protein
MASDLLLFGAGGALGSAIGAHLLGQGFTANRGGVRPQVHLYPLRLQSQTPRPPGRHRPGEAAPPARVHRGSQTQLAAAPPGPRTPLSHLLNSMTAAAAPITAASGFCCW